MNIKPTFQGKTILNNIKILQKSDYFSLRYLGEETFLAINGNGKLIFPLKPTETKVKKFKWSNVLRQTIKGH